MSTQGRARLRRQAAQRLADDRNSGFHLPQFGHDFPQAAVGLDAAHAGTPFDAQDGALVFGDLSRTAHVQCVGALQFGRRSGGQQHSRHQ
jgi:hypothetical protein